MMTDQEKQTKAGATKLMEGDLEEVQGGYANLEVSHLKGKKTPKTAAGGDSGGGRSNSFQDGEDLL